ncbi:hypothetical protein V8C35DRAFT_311070, partial [Trichoderma chlorosporum]
MGASRLWTMTLPLFFSQSPLFACFFFCFSLYLPQNGRIALSQRSLVFFLSFFLSSRRVKDNSYSATIGLLQVAVGPGPSKTGTDVQSHAKN